LRFLRAELDAQRAAGRGDRKVPIAEPPHQVERLSWRLLERQAERVLLHALLDRLSHVLRSPEKAVGGDQPRQRLVRPLEIVAVDEEPDPSAAVDEVRKHRALQKLVPQRLPESLHLAEGLRMLRPRADVPDPKSPELALKVRLAAPGRVLPAVIGQKLLGRAVLGDAARQGLHHQLRALVVCQRVAHDEARVVVHERRQINSLVASQEKRENVRLPELIRRSPFEAPRSVLAHRRAARSRASLNQPCFVQDAPHLRLADPERLEALEHVPDPPRTPLWMLCPERYHRVPPHLLSH
jgi:hypothetical protein